jgi:hypothetical protein
LLGTHKLRVGSTDYKLKVFEVEDPTHSDRHPLSFEYTTEHAEGVPTFQEYIRKRVSEDVNFSYLKGMPSLAEVAVYGEAALTKE